MHLGLCAALCLGSISCGSTTPGERQPLSVQVDRAAEDFFDDLAGKGTEAQSYVALFLPERAVNKRHLLRFREALENALRRAAPKAGMQYNASADRVFFMSEHRPPGWKDPAGGGSSPAVLAREFKAGTPEGWTILHAFWSQYNRLLIGDDAWIQGLPESIRADLSHPLRYVVRAWVSLESNPDVTTYIHALDLELVEVGMERTISSERYPLILSYPLP